ncbi:MAG: hypothetical protein IPJ39_22795 [Saprospiraceae bacterium]|nr:hypothetical protein [Saprospiraceae bacterium]
MGKYENANEILNQLNTMAEQFQSIRLLTEILNLKAFLNLNQGNFANAALLIEQCIKTKLSYNISNLFEEEYLKEK